MKVMMVVPASEVRTGDRLLMSDRDDTRPSGQEVLGVFSTGHRRVQLTLDQQRWFDADALLVVLRDAP